jgi:hypothetical protein
LQVVVTLTDDVGRQRRRKHSRSTDFVAFIVGGAWRRRAAIIPAVPEVFLCNSWIFKGLFCKF